MYPCPTATIFWAFRWKICNTMTPWWQWWEPKRTFTNAKRWTDYYFELFSVTRIHHDTPKPYTVKVIFIQFKFIQVKLSHKTAPNVSLDLELWAFHHWIPQPIQMIDPAALLNPYRLHAVGAPTGEQLSWLSRQAFDHASIACAIHKWSPCCNASTANAAGSCKCPVSTWHCTSMRLSVGEMCCGCLRLKGKNSYLTMSFASVWLSVLWKRS